MSITIRPIQPEDIPAVKRVIFSVAYRIFGGNGTLEESMREYEATGALDDVDSPAAHYSDAGGIFLVALDDARVIGSGALRRLDSSTVELKRMWLLEDYHGRGIGFRLISQLLAFARAQGYERMVLQTSSQQARALAFYRRLGFREIASYNDDQAEVSMGLALAGTKSQTGRLEFQEGDRDENG